MQALSDRLQPPGPAPGHGAGPGEIFLLRCLVAGTTHVDLEDVEPGLVPGALVGCRREPRNRHDPLAIRLQDGQGRKLGYVPRRQNPVLARLLDAGKTVYGRLVRKDREGGWLKLEVDLYLWDG